MRRDLSKDGANAMTRGRRSCLRSRRAWLARLPLAPATAYTYPFVSEPSASASFAGVWMRRYAPWAMSRSPVNARCLRPASKNGYGIRERRATGQPAGWSYSALQSPRTRHPVPEMRKGVELSLFFILADLRADLHQFFIIRC